MSRSARARSITSASWGWRYPLFTKLTSKCWCITRLLNAFLKIAARLVQVCKERISSHCTAVGTLIYTLRERHTEPC